MSQTKTKLLPFLRQWRNKQVKYFARSEKQLASFFYIFSCLNLLIQLYTHKAIKRLSFCPYNQKVAPLKISFSFQQKYYIKKKKEKALNVKGLERRSCFCDSRQFYLDRKDKCLKWKMV